MTYYDQRGQKIDTQINAETINIVSTLPPQEVAAIGLSPVRAMVGPDRTKSGESIEFAISSNGNFVAGRYRSMILALDDEKWGRTVFVYDRSGFLVASMNFFRSRELILQRDFHYYETFDFFGFGPRF